MSRQLMSRLDRYVFLAMVTPGLVFMSAVLFLSSRNPFGDKRFTLFDDAMISMDYGRTLFKTGSFVWFPGAPRVQGITNPLWALWMGLIHFVGLQDSAAALAVSITGVVLIIAASWVAFTLIRRGLPQVSPWIIAAVTGAIPFSFPTIYWTLRGMEVGLLSLLTLLLIRGICDQLENHSKQISVGVWIPMLLGIATRFDFVLLCLIAVLYLTWWSEHQYRLRVIAWNGLFIGLCTSSLCLFQKLYWGSWFPNTYHLKMDGATLVERLSRGMSSGVKAIPLAILLVIALLAARGTPRVCRQIVTVSISMFFGMAVYATYIGGDAWEDTMLNRFYSTMLPLIPVVLILAFHRTNDNRRNLRHVWIGSAIAISLAVSGLIPTVKQYRERDVLFTRTNHYVTETTLSLRDIIEPDSVVATVWAGVPAYYLRSTMLDLLGKNDVRIAHSSPHGSFFPGHNKWDYNYSIGELHPDVIFQTFTRGLEPDLPVKIKQWGYQRKCFIDGISPPGGMYFRSDSTKVLWEALRDCS